MDFLNWAKDMLNQAGGGKYDIKPEHEKIIEQLLKEVHPNNHLFSYKVSKNANTEVLKQLPSADKLKVLLYVHQKMHHDWLANYKVPHLYEYHRAMGQLDLIKELLKSGLAVESQDYIRLLQSYQVAFQAPQHYTYLAPFAPLLRQIKLYTDKYGVDEVMREGLLLFAEQNLKGSTNKDIAKLNKTIEEIIAKADAANSTITPPLLLSEEDEFGVMVNSDIASLPIAKQDIWYAILRHASKANGSKPSAKYLKDASALLADLGEAAFYNQVAIWIEALATFKNKTAILTHNYGSGSYQIRHVFLLKSENQDILKGLIWMHKGNSQNEVLTYISKAAEVCYKKIPEVGSSAGAAGNACVYVLAQAGMDGMGFLLRLKLRAKQPQIRKLIEKYIAEMAQSLGISISALEDMAIDSHGLINGQRTWQVGDLKAVLSIAAKGKVEVVWQREDGTTTKSVPAKTNEGYLALVKEIKLVASEVQKSFAAQKSRFDQFYKLERTWSYEDFDKFFLSHGLVNVISNELIWHFTDGEKSFAAIKHNGTWVDANDQEVTGIGPGITVKLWHPAEHNMSEIVVWRQFMVRHQLLQPFKQAYREVYLLTDAELVTRTYSNRMAAHLLKQHQFSTLAKGRGWNYTLMGSFDHGGSMMATTMLPSINLQAQFWVTEIYDQTAMSGAGIWLYMGTDQVRFRSPRSNGEIALDTIPPVLFSEVMRDVDLFVGVASVGNDPNWRDNGGMPDYRDYWTSYSFGDLSELAKTRKQTLENLLPKLKIAKVSSIDGNFLVVQGKIRTYKIHIGSTNILMAPDDQYLCIVQNANAKEVGNIFLPFEGDSAFSVLISKAFLLAEDDKIKDPSITSQIKMK